MLSNVFYIISPTPKYNRKKILNNKKTDNNIAQLLNVSSIRNCMLKICEYEWEHTNCLLVNNYEKMGKFNEVMARNVTNSPHNRYIFSVYFFLLGESGGHEVNKFYFCWAWWYWLDCLLNIDSCEFVVLGNSLFYKLRMTQLTSWLLTYRFGVEMFLFRLKE